jgi:hypothetical protein
MGKPTSGHALVPRSEYIGPVEGTGGIETSQYPEEEKTNVSPLVAASETGSVQTSVVSKPGGVATEGSWDPSDRAPDRSGSYKVSG